MQTLIRIGIGCSFLAALTALCGCAAGAKCNGDTMVVTVAPASATANHAAASPANQVQFVGSASFAAGPGCAAPALSARVYAQWTNPEPEEIQISSANDSTNGTAVCLESTDGPVTLTGSFGAANPQPVTKTVQLTCQ
jgi:hypothetical protein